MKTRKQENASNSEAKITSQYPEIEFYMKEERSSPLKSFVLTALVKNIVPTITKAKESV